MPPYTKVKKHTFNGKEYRIIWKTPPKKYKAYGICAPPSASKKNRKIMVTPTLKTKDFMTILIHEAIHAEQWYLDEPDVERIGISLGDLLWKCGFRLLDENDQIIKIPKKSRRCKQKHSGLRKRGKNRANSSQ